MAQYRVIKMLRATFEAQKEKALMTFEVLVTIQQRISTRMQKKQQEH